MEGRMAIIHLLSETMDECLFEKNSREDREIRLEPSVKLSVRFSEKDSLAVGDAIVTIQDAGHEGLFRIKFHHLARFRIESPLQSDAEKKAVHMEAGRILHPLWNRTLRSFCVTAGIPVIQLPPYTVSEERIKTG